MKKETLYLVLVLVLVTIMTVSGTYAFFWATNNSRINAVRAESYDYELLFTKGDDIIGNLDLALDRNGGYNSSFSLQMGNNSPLPEVSAYIDIDDISTNTLMVDGSPWQKSLKWEIEGYQGSTMVYSDSGDFLDCSINGGQTCVTGEKLYVVRNFDMSFTKTIFTVYIWLDAEIADNGANGSHISARVGATTEHYTGKLT